MAIETWIEKLLKEEKGKEIVRQFEEGMKIYKELPSYKHVKEPMYSILMQIKNDYVYQRITKGEKK